MNFDQAIVAHSGWKSKIEAYLDKLDGSLNPSDIQSDRNCALGQWIYGEGQKWSASSAFIELKARHLEFHSAAAALVRKAAAGHPVKDQIAVGSKSEFITCSSAVVNAIVRMKKEAQ